MVEYRGPELGPRVVAIRAGQTLELVAADGGLHDFMTLAADKAPDEWLNSEVGPRFVRTYRVPSVFDKIRCAIHPPPEEVYVAVLGHPFFTLSGRDGRFYLPAGVAPGRYAVTAAHPDLGTVTREVEVGAGQRAGSLDLCLDPQ